jgi:hypothetical protein
METDRMELKSIIWKLLTIFKNGNKEGFVKV